MSRTLSVLIVENFVINEGPKWDKFKRGAKTAAILVPWILGGWGAHNANAAQKAADDYKASHISYTNDARMANSGAEKYDDWSWEAVKKGDHKKALDYRDVSMSNANMAAVAKERADRASKLAKEKQIESHVSSAGAGAGAATGVAALLALKKGKKKKEEKKSLEERLNTVKSGMYLNEENKKERYSDGHTPESIATLHNVPVQDILDQIEKGIKVEREHTTDKAEARLIAMDHLVELPDYYTRLDKMEEEGKMENSINESEKKQTAKQNKKLSKIVLEHPELFLEEELLNEGIIKKTLGTLGTLVLGASLWNTGANLKDRHDWKSHAENMSHQEVMEIDDWLNRTENINRKDDDDYKEKERQLQLAKDRQGAFKKAKKNLFQKSVTYGNKVTEGRNDRPFTQKVGDLARKITGK